jgi:hypothetical protein
MLTTTDREHLTWDFKKRTRDLSLSGLLASLLHWLFAELGFIMPSTVKSKIETTHRQGKPPLPLQPLLPLLPLMQTRMRLNLLRLCKNLKRWLYQRPHQQPLKRTPIIPCPHLASTSFSSVFMRLTENKISSVRESA